MLGAGDGVAGNEVDALRYMRPDDAHHMRLDRTDIGEDGAGLERRGNAGRQRVIGADGGAEDDEIGIAHGLGGVERVDVPEIEAPRLVQRLLPPRGDGNDLHQPWRRAASAMDEPRRPMPISAILVKCTLMPRHPWS